MQSRKTSSQAANRSGSRSNGSSRSSSSKLDPTGMYKKPSQQQVKCHYLDPTGLYWEKRRGRAAGVTHSRAAHPTNVNCDLVLGTHHGSGFGSDSGEEQRQRVHTREMAQLRILWLRVRGREETSSCRRRRKLAGTVVKSAVKLQTLEPSEDVPGCFASLGCPRT